MICGPESPEHAPKMNQYSLKKASADSLILVIPVSPYLQNNATEPQDMISSDDNDLITCNFENDTSELHISSCYLHKRNKDSKKKCYIAKTS